MKQREIWETEGKRWLERNPDTGQDPVIDFMKDHKLRPRAVLEIGCGDGRRLRRLKDIGLEIVWGMDPSIERGHLDYKKGVPGMLAIHGCADRLGNPPRTVDLIIYGFCLYQVDPEELASVMSESNRVLTDGGYIIIHDFYPDFPHSKKYAHDSRLKTYKMQWEKLWLGNPCYRLVDQTFMRHDPKEDDSPDNRVAITLLQKDMEGAFPLC